MPPGDRRKTSQAVAAWRRRISPTVHLPDTSVRSCGRKSPSTSPETLLPRHRAFRRTTGRRRRVVWLSNLGWSHAPSKQRVRVGSTKRGFILRTANGNSSIRVDLEFRRWVARFHLDSQRGLTVESRGDRFDKFVDHLAGLA